MLRKRLEHMPKKLKTMRLAELELSVMEIEKGEDSEGEFIGKLILSSAKSEKSRQLIEAALAGDEHVQIMLRAVARRPAPLEKMAAMAGADKPPARRKIA